MRLEIGKTYICIHIKHIYMYTYNEKSFPNVILAYILVLFSRE